MNRLIFVMTLLLSPLLLAATCGLPALVPGIELYQSTGDLQIDLPPDFFSPGSPAYSGVVALEGSPLGHRGAHELGTTDTVLFRPGRIVLKNPSNLVPIEISELSLRSVDPIFVDEGGGPQPWQVQVRLSSTPQDEMGSLTLGTSIEGPFSASIPLQFDLVLEQGARQIVAPQPNLWLEGGGVAYDECSSDGLNVSRLGLRGCRDMDLDSPILSLALTPAQVDPSRPGADVHPGASVDPKVGSLGRYATISDGASIGKGAVVGPYAYIGPNVVIGDFVHVGAFAIVEQGSILEWGASVGDYAFLSANTHMGPGSSISTGAGTGMNTQIGTGADIGAGSLIGEGVVIGDWVNAGPLVDIRDFAEVAPEVQLAEGSRIFSGVYQDQDLSLCSVDMEGTNAGPANLCSLLGGAVIGQIGYPGVLTGMPAPGTRVTPIDPDNLPVALGSLAEDVEETRPTTPYSEEYDCDDFASDLEIALEGLDYDATFTCYWQRNPNRHWYNFYKEPLWLSGHCVTDVHDGEDLIWVEPQTGEVGIDLDFDGDGKVEFSSAHGSATTEDGYRVEVYDSRASAEAAGVQMD